MPKKRKAGTMMDRTAILTGCQRRLKYTFSNPELLWEALQAELVNGPSGGQNKRLAFVGDSVLSLALRIQAMDRGYRSNDITRELNQVETNEYLGHVGRAAGIDEFIVAEDGDRIYGRNGKNVADAMEAILAAVFRDCGNIYRVIEVMCTLGLRLPSARSQMRLPQKRVSGHEKPAELIRPSSTAVVDSRNSGHCVYTLTEMLSARDAAVLPNPPRPGVLDMAQSAGVTAQAALSDYRAPAHLRPTYTGATKAPPVVTQCPVLMRKKDDSAGSSHTKTDAPSTVAVTLSHHGPNGQMQQLLHPPVASASVADACKASITPAVAPAPALAPRPLSLSKSVEEAPDMHMFGLGRIQGLLSKARRLLNGKAHTSNTTVIDLIPPEPPKKSVPRPTSISTMPQFGATGFAAPMSSNPWAVTFVASHSKSESAKERWNRPENARTEMLNAQILVPEVKTVHETLSPVDLARVMVDDASTGKTTINRSKKRLQRVNGEVMIRKSKAQKPMVYGDLAWMPNGADNKRRRILVEQGRTMKTAIDLTVDDEEIEEAQEVIEERFEPPRGFLR